LVGTAILRQLEAQGFRRIVGREEDEPDLTDRTQVERFFAERRPDYVFLAAGKSGGIGANQRRPATLMLDNLLVVSHVMAAAQRFGVRKLLYLASACSYPRDCRQPMRVEDLGSGPLEPTNQAYGTAKLAGIRLCEAYAQEHGAHFFAGIPATPFGPGDHWSPEDAHVIPSLFARMHAAKESGLEAVEVWGTGKPRREFIYADDLADACIFLMRNYRGRQAVNLGSGIVLSIRALAKVMAEVVGYFGEVHFDPTRPDGMPVKVLDSGPLRAMGWRPKACLWSALATTYEGFLATRQVREAVPA
jgi:GDP-L-fucose synthase